MWIAASPGGVGVRVRTPRRPVAPRVRGRTSGRACHRHPRSTSHPNRLHALAGPEAPPNKRTVLHNAVHAVHPDSAAPRGPLIRLPASFLLLRRPPMPRRGRIKSAFGRQDSGRLLPSATAVLALASASVGRASGPIVSSSPRLRISTVCGWLLEASVTRAAPRPRSPHERYPSPPPSGGHGKHGVPNLCPGRGVGQAPPRRRAPEAKSHRAGLTIRVPGEDCFELSPGLLYS
jgi:hypothetical protein